PLALGLLITFVDWRTALQIWAIPGLAIGLLYALLGAEDGVEASERRDYRRALWEDVLKNKTVFSLVVVSTFRAMGQTALSAFLPLYLSLHLKLSGGAAARSRRQHRCGALRSQYGRIFSRPAHGRSDRRCLRPPGSAAVDLSLSAARSRRHDTAF